MFCEVLGALGEKKTIRTAISAPTARVSRCDEKYPRLCHVRSQKTLKKKGWEDQHPSDDTLYLE